jgi:hypothetical protein
MMLPHLLWKDARQVLPSVAVCLGLAVLGQFLFISRWLRNEDFFRLDIPRSLAMIGPMIVALACAGMIFGNERQSRTSHWLSSLPIQWYQSISSQFVIGSACIVIAALVTHSIARFAPNVDHDPFMGFLYASSLSKVFLFSGLLFCFSIIGTLLFEETLYGLSAAGIAFISTNALVGYLVEKALSYNGWNSDQAKYDAVLYPSLSLLALLTLAGSVGVYRWRWSLGQFVDSWRAIQQTLGGRWRSNTEAVAKSIPHRICSIPAVYPLQPFWTLLRQSLHQAPYLRIALVVAPWVIALVHERKEFPQAAGFYSILSVLILGLSCFVADHSKYRFRFLADRGVPAWKFYWARTLPLLGIGVLMMTAAIIVPRWLLLPKDHFAPQNWEVIPFLLATLFFFAGQLASLCFRNVLIAIGAVLATLFGILCMFAIFESNQHSPQGLMIFPVGVLDMIAIVAAFASIVAYLLLVVYWLIPTWSRTDRPERRLAGGYVVSGILVPIFLLYAFAIIGFWMIPRPTWISDILSPTELAASQPKSHAIEFSLKNRTELFKICGFLNSPLANANGHTEHFINASHYGNFLLHEIHAMTLDDANVAKAIDWLTELNVDLDRSLSRLQTSNPSKFEIEWQDLQSLQHYSATCAAMSRLAILRRESLLLETCFDCAKKMQLLQPWIDPVSRIDLHRRILAVLSTCSDDDLKWLAKSYSIQPLLNEVTSLAQYRQWVIERSLFIEKRQHSAFTNVNQAHEWEELNRYRWRSSMRITYPSTWYSALPRAIGMRESSYCMARAFRAELEVLDRLINLESRGITSQGRQNLESFAIWQNIPQPPREFGFHVRDLMQYRELRESIADRVLSNDVRNVSR